MKLNHVVIVHKKPRQKKDVPIHDLGLREISKALDERGIPHISFERGHIKTFKADLAISLGGDGTFLAAAHAAGSTPILGVNSMPGSSVGFFCCARLSTLEEKLDGIIAGKFKPTLLPVIDVKIGGLPLPVRAVNDVLFARESPAEMTRYWLKIGRTREYQRSSGIWISSGPGSTAAIRSAGGRKMKLTLKNLQYVVREPYEFNNGAFKLRRGILARGENITIVPERDAYVYIDGHQLSYPVPASKSLTLSTSKTSLKVYLDINT